MQIMPNSKDSQYYITSLTHGINMWFKTQLLRTICKQSAHLDPHMDAWGHLRTCSQHAP